MNKGGIQTARKKAMTLSQEVEGEKDVRVSDFRAELVLGSEEV